MNRGYDKILQRNAVYEPAGSFRMGVSTGAVTLIAAATATAGQIFALRWSSSTKNMYLRYFGARFITTTAFNAAQEVGCDLIVASAFSVNATDGTAVDCGSTTAATGKVRETLAKSAIIANACRVASTAAITAGTHTLHANAMGRLAGWSAAIGDVIPSATRALADSYGILFDARDDKSAPLVFDADSGFVVRNTIAMGAGGVGRWDFLMEWDEGTDA